MVVPRRTRRPRAVAGRACSSGQAARAERGRRGWCSGVRRERRVRRVGLGPRLRAGRQRWGGRRSGSRTRARPGASGCPAPWPGARGPRERERSCGRATGGAARRRDIPRAARASLRQRPEDEGARCGCGRRRRGQAGRGGIPPRGRHRYAHPGQRGSVHGLRGRQPRSSWRGRMPPLQRQVRSARALQGACLALCGHYRLRNVAQFRPGHAPAIPDEGGAVPPLPLAWRGTGRGRARGDAGREV
mmetsp:Transcript_9520/g.27828  ORF Transcript_9520/g.27828 Transcript_9520/m.27828 type:complete len:245 (-) Transcript_9520:1376-2110(-)